MARSKARGERHIAPTAVCIYDEDLRSRHLAALTKTDPAVRGWPSNLHIDVAIAGRCCGIGDVQAVADVSLTLLLSTCICHRRWSKVSYLITKTVSCAQYPSRVKLLLRSLAS